MDHPAASLTGEWSGTYAYPARAGPTTPFVARIQDQGGALSGTIIEPTAGDGPPLEATISGLTHDGLVDFTKTYAAGAPEGYETPVDYVGRLFDDGTVIRGVWSLLNLDGTFEMHREAADETPAAAEEAAALSDEEQ